MGNNENKKIVEAKDLLKALIKTNNRVGLLSLSLILVGFFIIDNISDIKIPLILWISLLFIVFMMSIYLYFLKKATTLDELETIIFLFYIVTIFVSAPIINYLGGIESIGVLIYSFSIIGASIILSRKRTVIIIIMSIIGYSFIGFFEYYGIIPHHEVFFVGGTSYKNLFYLIFTVSIWGILALNQSSLITNNLSHIYKKIGDILKGERKQLMSAHSKLRESKESLEIRVNARTKELKDLTEGLEEQVRQSTNELEQKVKELELSQKITIDRELKMIKLKEKIREVE